MAREEKRVASSSLLSGPTGRNFCSGISYYFFCGEGKKKRESCRERKKVERRTSKFPPTKKKSSRVFLPPFLPSFPLRS